MLSAFKAQPIHELKPRDKSKIESLLAYGDRLLVGLSTGALRIYRVNEAGAGTNDSVENGEATNTAKSRAVELLREEEKFGKRPIQQLAIIKESNILISLSDGYISLHDLQTYQLVERLEVTKGATCFAVTSNIVKDPDTDIPSLVSRLAVGVKRKLLCWTWQMSEQMPDVVEISLESPIKSLVWATGKTLVVGMDPGFSVVDAETQVVTPINKPASRAAADARSGEPELAGVRFGAVSSSGMGYMGMASWVPKPMATPLSDGQVLLAKDVNTLFIGADGEALEKRQVPWNLAPEAIGYSYPYLLGLQPPEKGSLQIRNPDTLSLLQTIAVPGASILHVPQPNISLAHAGKGFLVASDRVIWRMNALGYDAQLADLANSQRYDEAVSLLTLLEDTLIEDKAGRIREVKSQKATTLFQQQKYRPALDLFIDAETSPRRVIALYPQSVAGDLTQSDGDRHESVSESGDSKTEQGSKEPPSTPSKTLFGRVTGGRGRSGSDASTEAGSPRKSVNASSNAAEPKPLEGDNLKVAVRCLCSFLASARVQIQKHLNFEGKLKESPPSLDPETGKPAFANLLPDSVFDSRDQEVDWQAELVATAQLVDTTLFRSYMLASPSLAGPLFRLDNFCDPAVVQSSLYDGGRYGDLIDFLHGKKLHRQALEMLARFGKGDADDEIPDGMRGPARTVGYLKQLPPESIQLVLEFVKWPLQTEPQTGMEVFLADTENAEQLPRRRVLEFLSDFGDDLKIQYLEHIINELNDTTGDFHQELIDHYLATLKSPSTASEEKPDLQTRLEAFLAKSKLYNKSHTLRHLPADDPTFYESRALVFSALGSHKQALDIYVFRLHDYARAETYCNATHLSSQPQQPTPDPSSSTTTNLYATLLALYLQPPPGESQRWPQALDLLSNHGARLPASSTLALMPADLAVAELRDYFRGRLRSATAARRQARVVRALEKVRHGAVEGRLALGAEMEAGGAGGGGGGWVRPGGRNRRVRVAEGDVCPVCLRRFGNSAVRVYPDGGVVHYGCKRAGDGGGKGAGTTARERNWG